MTDPPVRVSSRTEYGTDDPAAHVIATFTVRAAKVSDTPTRNIPTAGRVTPLRGSCRTFRMQLETAQGKAAKTFRC